MSRLRCGHARFRPATPERVPPTDVALPRVRIAAPRSRRRRRQRQLPVRAVRPLLAGRARPRPPGRPPSDGPTSDGPTAHCPTTHCPTADGIVTISTNGMSVEPAAPAGATRRRSSLSPAVLAKADLDRSLLAAGLLAVSCWCERHVVAVSRTEVQRGRTASCGHCRCRPPRRHDASQDESTL